METKEQESAPVVSKGTATQDMLEHIIANPQEYGFEWRYDWTPAKGTGKDKVLMRGKVPAPLPFAIDADLFSRSFGGTLLTQAFNGTSGRVEAQDVVRTEIEKNRKITDSDLQRAIVRSVLFAIRRVGGGGGTRTVFIVNGKQFKTEAEALAASKVQETYRDVGGGEHATMLESQQASIAIMTQYGMSHADALKALGIGQ
jgi:hypothetical protein